MSNACRYCGVEIADKGKNRKPIKYCCTKHSSADFKLRMTKGNKANDEVDLTKLPLCLPTHTPTYQFWGI